MSDVLVTDIQVPFPNAAGYHLVIEVDGVQLNFTPQASPLWVEGKSTYKRPPAPTIEQVGGEVKLKQIYTRSELTNMFRVAGDSPLLEVKLSTQQAYALTLNALGDSTHGDLGGIALKKLDIKCSLGSVLLDFSVPNPHPLDLFNISGQAAQVELSHLGNANATKLTLDGKVGTHKLHWGTPLQQDAVLELFSQSTPTTLSLPAHSAVKIHAMSGAFDYEIVDFDLDGDFKPHEGGFWSGAALAGKSPVLTVKVQPSIHLAVNFE